MFTCFFNDINGGENSVCLIQNYVEPVTYTINKQWLYEMGEVSDPTIDSEARIELECVNVIGGDGYFGWEEHAPYDAIIVTAAPDHIPQPLVQQLEDGARLVIPVGPPGGYQSLWQVTKEGDQVKKRNVTGVLFVPLTGRALDKPQ